MPTTKSPLIRYKILDSCFRNPGRRYFIEDLIHECTEVLKEIDQHKVTISRKQILNDIAFMESAEGWSIDLVRTRVNRKVYYRYSDTSYSINNMPLNQVEIGLLQDSIQTLSQFKGMPKFEWLNELIPKLQGGINHTTKTASIMEFENNRFLKGLDKLETLYNAIFNKQVLKITYQTFKAEDTHTYIIHPYFLKSYNQRWFLFGYNLDVENLTWNLAIDRIETIETLQQQYLENTSIDWEEYFEDMVGVTRPKHAVIEKITLQFLGERGYYVETKPIHGSQKSTWIDKNILEVKLELIINRELISLLLSYGADIIVKHPNHLRNTLLTILKDAWNNYQVDND